MRGSVGDKTRFEHVLLSILEINSYIKNHTFEQFSANSMMKLASVKQLEIIGEAINHVSQETKNKFPTIEWTKVVALRNILVHEYFGIDENVIWDIIKKDLPPFEKQIQEVLNEI